LLVIIALYFRSFIMDFLSNYINVTKTGGSESDLQENYETYLKAREIEKTLGNNYELHNIIERFFMSNANLSNSPLIYNTDTKNKLVDELKQKNIKYNIDKMLKIIKKPVPDSDAVLTNTDGEIKYGKYTLSLNPERYEILINMGTIEQIMNVALKYAALLPNSQQWAVPYMEYKEHVDNGYEIEGFASPFNSQIIRIDPQLKYCSLFEEDKTFGSLGRFFDMDEEFNGKKIIVNPPFIEDILQKAAEKCIELLRKYPCSFMFYGPRWYDAKFYALLEESEFKIKTKKLYKFEYYYEDLFKNKMIKANFNSIIFEISSFDS